MSDLIGFLEDFDHYFNEHGSINREQFENIMRMNIGNRIYIAEKYFRFKDQNAMASRLLKNGVKRPQIVETLTAHFGCSKVTGYNRVNEVLGK